MGLPTDPVANNATLQAVSSLIAAAREPTEGVRAVLTYNYDNLLEMALNARQLPTQPIHSNRAVQDEALPIYHVHGFVPFVSEAGSTTDEIVFTESQYHLVASDPYHWSSLVQIQNLSSPTSLMIGLSLDD